MKFSTADINPKKSMVASSGMAFEVRSDINTFSNEMVQRISERDNADLQGQLMYIHYPAQEFQSEENNNNNKDDNDEPVKVTTQTSIDNNNLIQKFGQLNICHSEDVEEKTVSSSTQELNIKDQKTSIDKDAKIEKSSLSEEIKGEKSGTAEEKKDEKPKVSEKTKHEKTEETEETKQNIGAEETEEPVSVKTENDEKDETGPGNNINEKDDEKSDTKKLVVKMNIPFDEVVDKIDNLKLEVKTEEDEDVISRGPDKSRQNISNYRSTGPYTLQRYTTLQTGGGIIAQVSPMHTQVDQIALKEQQYVPAKRSDSPILRTEHYLSDDVEADILNSYSNLSSLLEVPVDIIDDKVTQPFIQEHYPNASSTEESLNKLLFELEERTSNVTNDNLQCLSPPLSDDFTDMSIFSPPYGSVTTDPPSPLSSTDCSSNCNSPGSSEDASDTRFGLNFPSLPLKFNDPSYNFPAAHQAHGNSMINICTWQNKPTTTNFPATKAPVLQRQAAVMESTPNNVNSEIVRPQNSGCVSSFNHAAIQSEPEVPSLETRTAFERLRQNQAENNEGHFRLRNHSDEKLCAADPDGDTQLLIMIARRLPEGEGLLYALVHRLLRYPDALAARNNQKHSALLLACMYMPDKPLVARFIAEALQRVKHDLNEEIYHNGSTIIHWLCERGDYYLNVLVELLSMRNEDGSSCFNINKYNHSTGTPLQVAVKAHEQDNVNCSKTIAFLLSQGANVTDKERFGGQTSLHLAIKESGDPLIVQMLLKAAERQRKDLVNCMDYPGDTALHYAHLRNDLPIQQQLRIITLLIQYGANSVTGSQGRMPLALVVPKERKEIIRANTQRRNRKS